MAQETAKSIAKWCADTFVDATYDGQTIKFLEEFEELIASGCKDIMEIADMYIVACSVGNFNYKDFLFLSQFALIAARGAGFSKDELQDAIDKKMQINRSRSWNCVGGQYKHKETEN